MTIREEGRETAVAVKYSNTDQAAHHNSLHCSANLTIGFLFITHHILLKEATLRWDSPQIFYPSKNIWTKLPKSLLTVEGDKHFLMTTFFWR